MPITEESNVSSQDAKHLNLQENISFESRIKKLSHDISCGSRFEDIELTQGGTLKLSGEFASREQVSDVTRMVETREYVIAGTLFYDECGSDFDPLEEGSANGAIYHHGRRAANAQERRQFFAALGLDADGFPDLTDEQFKTEMSRHVTEILSKNLSVMAVLSGALRSQGEPSEQADVLKVLADITLSNVREYILDDIARLFFEKKSWRAVSPAVKSKLEDLQLLFTENSVLEMWKSADLAGKVGNPLAVRLDIYEHGGRVYSISGEGMQCQWDTSKGSAVWVADRYAQETILTRTLSLLKVGNVRWFGTLGDKADPLCAKYSVDSGKSWKGNFHTWSEALRALRAASPVKVSEEELSCKMQQEAESYCRAILTEYNEWVNGQVFIVEVKVFDKATGQELTEESSSVGGYIGRETAENALEDAIVSTTKNLLAHLLS